MKVEFRKSFEKDLSKIRDEDLLLGVKVVIEEVEAEAAIVEIMTYQLQTLPIPVDE